MTATYLMGHSAAETQRLLRQAELLNGTTRRLLIEAGLSRGMSVLDLGTGAGDVAMLAAELVGPEGRVVGVDRNLDILDVARDRARRSGLVNVSFVQAGLATFEPTHTVDAMVGRLVLMYQADPIGLLGRLTRRLAPGGIAAFQEFNLSSSSLQSYPSMPLWRAFRAWVHAAVAHSGTEPLMGYKLAGVLSAVGLPTSRVWLESPLVAGPDLTWYSYMAESLRSLLPLAIAAGATTAEEVDIDTLAERLRAETLAVGGVAKAPDLVSVWARKP